ncbi:4034_t:CDS:2, partial [Racocetra persica]
MSTLPTDSFKISITTTTTTELNTLPSQPSQPTSSHEPEITISLDVTTPENITKHNSQISTLYANQELTRSATSLSSADYIVPSNDPRSSTQIFKLQNIDYSSFEGISPLGYGKSITILVSTWKNDNDMIKVALKKVETLAAFSQAVKENSNDSENKLLVDNINLLYKLSFHQNILSIFGYSYNPQNDDYFMVLQYAEGGNLRQYLENNHSKLSWTDKVRIIIDIASGLQYIHNHDIVHLSLHPHNILLHNEQLMISDLGISKSIPQKSSIYPTLPYIDPNYFASPTTYPRDKHLDIYSLGVIMHDISSGKRPFENLPYNQFLAIRLLEGLRLKPINGTPLELVDLYEQCWDIDASVRPTISDILARLGRLKLDSFWVDNDEIMGNNGKKNLDSPLEFNSDIKGIIMETKHAVFGSGNVTFSNGNISSIRDIEINENEIYGEEEKDE